MPYLPFTDAIINCSDVTKTCKRYGLIITLVWKILKRRVILSLLPARLSPQESCGKEILRPVPGRWACRSGRQTGNDSFAIL